MSGTPRTSVYLTGSEFPDNSTGLINAQDLRDLTASMFDTVPTLVSAAGTTQGTATTTTAQFVIVTACAAGAGIMPTAGYTKIWNATANNCNIYPVSGAQINAAGVNNATFVAAGGSAEVCITSTTQEYAR